MIGINTKRGYFMFSDVKIESIRILPSDKSTFNTEHEFREFIVNTMVSRDGLYYFPNLMMKCPKNTLVLFQYDGMIRAVGLLIDAQKTSVIDERGIAYSGYYKFDIGTLSYLDIPIDKAEFKTVYPLFSSFNQSKQKIPLTCLPNIINILQRKLSKSANTNKSSIAEDLTAEIESLKLMGDEQNAIVKVRINQNIFREKLLKRYSKCCLCGVNNKELLTASHIKPWSQSTGEEKLDIDNGFILCPNHDKVFDSGLITFDDDGCIIISEELSAENRLFLNLRTDMKIPLTERNKKYLAYHRSTLFRK